MKTRAFTILSVLLFASPVSLYAAEQRPNFVVIFIDDLGNADISPFGKDRYDTPNLDRMAKDGRRYSNFYVASSVCTPSRAAIMTGCYPIRVDMLYNETRPPLPAASVLWPGSRKGLNPDEFTIAEVLKDRGYATACIGKWHLGDQPPFLPTRQGFDEYFGIPNGHDMGVRAKPFNLPPPMVKNEVVIEDLDPEDFGFLTKRYTEYALDFIQRNAKKPFFIYLPHNMVHGPHAASPAFLNKTGKGLYADTVAEVDWSVGQILDRLVELKIDKRTLVLFTSDNGGGFFMKKSESQRKKARYSSNAPYSGGKATPAEGGFRVPTIAWWPATIEAGSSTDLMASTMDLLPTFASLAGRPFKPKVPIDGVDGAPALVLSWPGQRELLLLACMGLLAAVSHQMIANAFARAEAGALAPLQYLEIISAVLIGWFVFGDFPDRLTWAGTAIIIGAGTYVFYRERQLARRLA